MEHKKWEFAGHAMAVVLLTVITQIGGILWLLTLVLTSYLPGFSFPKWRFIGYFVVLYTVFTICIIPFLAHWLAEWPYR